MTGVCPCFRRAVATARPTKPVPPPTSTTRAAIGSAVRQPVRRRTALLLLLLSLLLAILPVELEQARLLQKLLLLPLLSLLPLLAVARGLRRSFCVPSVRTFRNGHTASAWTVMADDSVAVDMGDAPPRSEADAATANLASAVGQQLGRAVPMKQIKKEL
jgi:hypothetical protein